MLLTLTEVINKHLIILHPAAEIWHISECNRDIPLIAGNTLAVDVTYEDLPYQETG